MHISSRRRFVGFVAATALSTAFGPAAGAQTNDDADGEFDGLEPLDPLPATFDAGLSAGNYRPTQNFGSEPPPPLYVRIAEIILKGAPVRCRPFDVARYFSDVRMGQIPGNTLDTLERYLRTQGRNDLFTTDFLKLFAYDWEQNNYYNPVVVQFITGIRQTPYAGDLTPWCAAFMNWCISRSQASNPDYLTFSGALLARGTRSASSGSFRCYGEETEEPREGDIVVWAKVGTEARACPVNLNNAQGHVGFFVNAVPRPDRPPAYRVLGGNQGFTGARPNSTASEVSQSDVAEAVSFRTIGKRFLDRTFHSVRTNSLLRGA